MGSVSQPVILITGVPGIGKSIFSLYLMIQIMIDEHFPIRSFVLEYESSKYQRITVLSSEKMAQNDFQVHLNIEKNVDLNPEQDLVFSDILTEQEPGGLGRWTCIFSLPNPKRFKYSMKAPHSYHLVMPTWSELELQFVQLIKESWYDRFIKFGGVPRHVLWEGTGRNPEIILQNALDAKGSIVMNYFFEYGFGSIDPETSYLLLHMNPPWLPNENDWDYEAKEIYSFASDEVFKLLSEKYRNSLLAKPINLFNAGVAPEVYGGGSAGNLFKKIILWLKPLANQTLSLTSLNAPEQTIMVTLPEMAFLDNNWKKQMGTLQEGFLYQPKICTLESGDSFCVVSVEGEYYLLVFQVTVGQTHPIRCIGLKTILLAFPEPIRSAIKKKIVVFVTPVDGKLQSVQAFHTQDGKVAQRLPTEVNDFQQYVCRISLVRS